MINSFRKRRASVFCFGVEPPDGGVEFADDGVDVFVSDRVLGGLACAISGSLPFNLFTEADGRFCNTHQAFGTARAAVILSVINAVGKTAQAVFCPHNG
ncbi:MAG: hypothetical protein AAFQ84_04555 [Pseudomonadota bacterium]